MYNPAEYWEKRLSGRFSLRGVGHQSYGHFYNRWLYKRKRKVLEHIFEGVHLSQKTVLDIGAGTGFFLEWYQSRGALTHGVDISPTAIRELSKRFPETELFELDFSDPAITLPQTYDIVNAWDVIYHQAEDPAFFEFLKNCAVACKRDGLFICTDGFGFPHSVNPAEHVKFRSRKTYRPLMESLGFKLVKEYPLYRLLNRPPGAGRLKRYLEQVLAPFFYWSDQYQDTPATDNLSVGVWIKSPAHGVL